MYQIDSRSVKYECMWISFSAQSYGISIDNMLKQANMLTKRWR